MKLIYEAYDGEQFDTEKECEQYEEATWEIIREIESAIELYDKGMRRLLTVVNHTIEVWLDSFELFYCDKSEYLRLIKPLSMAGRMFLMENLGLADIPEQRGLYKYSLDEFNWKACG